MTWPFSFLDLSEALDDDADPTQSAISAVASLAAAWPQLHQGQILSPKMAENGDRWTDESYNLDLQSISTSSKLHVSSFSWSRL